MGNRRHDALALPSLTRDSAGRMLATLIEPLVVQAIGRNFDRHLLLPQWLPPNARRPSMMARAMAAWLRDKRCLACNGRKRLQAHHVLPWHLWPQWGMESRLWLPLCRGNPEIDCHAIVGHAGCFRGVCVFAQEFAGMVNKVRAMNSELVRLLNRVGT